VPTQPARIDDRFLFLRKKDGAIHIMEFLVGYQPVLLPMPDRDTHDLDAARVSSLRLRRLRYRTDDPVGPLIGVVAGDRNECPQRGGEPADYGDLQDQAKDALPDLSHREKDRPGKKQR
jgi:hypothetical protein